MAENNIPQALLPNEAIPGFDAISAQAAQDQALMPQAPAAQEPQPESPYQYQLLQNENDTILPVSQDEADVAIRSGLYSPKNDEEFIVLDKYGNRSRVSGVDLRSVMQEGQRLETTQERHERELQEQYGDQDVAAGIEGVARGAMSIPSLLSAGLPGSEGEVQFTPDEAMQGLSELTGDNWTPEQLRARAEANPVSSMVGNIAGSLSTGNALGAGRVVKATEAAVSKAVLKEGLKAGLGKKIAATIASRAAGGAVEGAYYATGDLLSEHSLGHADVNAENLASSVGYGALLGGGFGTAFGAVEASIPLLRKSGDLASGHAAQYTNRQKAALELTGYTPAKAAKVIEKNPALVNDLPDFLTNEVGLQSTDDVNSLLKKAESLKSKSGTGIGETIKKFDKIIDEAPEFQTPKKFVYKDLASELDEKFMNTKSGSPESRAKLKQAGAYYDELIKSSFEDGKMTLKALQEARQNAYDLGYTSLGLPVETLEGKMARYAGRYYSDTLKDMAEKISEKSNEQALYKEFIKSHKNYSYISEILPKLKAKAAKGDSLNPIVMSVLGGATGGILGDGDLGTISAGTIAALGARSFLRSDLRRSLVVLGKIEKANQKVNKIVNGAVTKFSDTSKAISLKDAPKLIPLTVMQSEFAKKYEDGKYKKPKDKSEAWANMQDNFDRYAQDPEAFMGRVNRNTSTIYNQAPDTSTALDALAVRGAMFLGSKLPRRQSNPSMLGMFNKAKPPSQLDLSKFERYLNTVENPEYALNQFSSGRMSVEAAEALKAVYPSIYEKLQNAALEHVSKNPKLPYNKKLQLGLLLDIPTDESLLPENVLALQQNYSPEQPQAGPAPTTTGLSKLNVAERQETDTQDSGELG